MGTHLVFDRRQCVDRGDELQPHAQLRRILSGSQKINPKPLSKLSNNIYSNFELTNFRVLLLLLFLIFLSFRYQN